MRRVYYGLSADPVTLGHVWVIQQAAKMFDEVTVAVANNPSKRHDFSLDARVNMTAEACHHLPTVKVVALPPDEFLVRAAREAEAEYLIRGLRNGQDYAYESDIARFNAELEPTVKSVFIQTPAHLAGVSSSFVKGLVGLRGWEELVRQYVPVNVFHALRIWHEKGRKPV